MLPLLHPLHITGCTRSAPGKEVLEKEIGDVRSSSMECICAHVSTASSSPQYRHYRYVYDLGTLTTGKGMAHL